MWFGVGPKIFTIGSPRKIFEYRPRPIEIRGKSVMSNLATLKIFEKICGLGLDKINPGFGARS